MLELDINTFLIELAIVGFNTIILGLVFLFKRSIRHMDNQIARIITDTTSLQATVNGNAIEPGIKSRVSILEERADTHDEHRLRSDKQINKILDNMQALTKELSQQGKEKTEQIGELNARLSECVGILKILASKHESL